MSVIDLMADEIHIDRKNLIGQLEQNRQQANNIAGKLANRDAVELVRNNSERSLH